MAASLVTGGHDVRAWNRTRGKAGPLEALGAQVAASPADAVAAAEVCFTMLSDPPAVRAAALGDRGFLSSLARGSLWVDCSTVNPSFSREMASLAARRGVRFLDAPVAGTIGPAAEGKLTFFVGGDASDIGGCRPLLDLMGRAVVHVGPTGAGTSLKMVLNMLLAHVMTGFAEATALGRALGLEEKFLLDAILGGPLAAPYLSTKRIKMEGRSFEAEFPLKLLYKDVQLATASGYERGVPMPASAAVRELCALACRDGRGDQDFSVLYAWLGDPAAAARR